LGWAGFGHALVAQFLLVGYGAMGKSPNALRVLQCSLAAFFMAWVLLLASWAVFAGTIDDKATCTVMDASATGAVVASGNFGDIVHGSGSYSYAFVIGAWILLNLIIGVVAHRIFTEIKRVKAAKAKTSADNQADPINPKENPDVSTEI